MSLVFGIDLGTTYSCIAYYDEYGKPVVLKNSDGEHTTPSVVMIEDNNIVVGNEAKRSIEVEPDKTCQFIKRKMGKDNDTVKIDGKEYHAPEISAYILKKIVADANEELKQSGVIKEGEEIKDVVITCPAYFGMNEKQATKTAGELAGLNVLNIINEPTAAAISYGVSGQNKDETVLVYDLGGGTFDITVMNIKGSNISVVCTGGDDTLGGKDWDEACMTYVMERYEEETGESLDDDPDAVASLYIDVETWKKSLTSREKVNISANGPGGKLREELTRAKYEEITKPLLDRTKNLLDDIIKTSTEKGYPLSKIDKILLVGGSSRMPQVANMIKNDYGIDAQLQDPDEAVAKGAAIFANNEKEFNDFVEQEAVAQGKTVEELKESDLVTGAISTKFASASGGISSKLSITNVLSSTYGMETLDDKDQPFIANMLMINTPLPATVTKTFYTHSEGQTSIAIKIYESRSNDEALAIEGRTPVTKGEGISMKFNSSKPLPQSTPLEISFTLDNSGFLHILAKELLYQGVAEADFELSNQLSKSDVAAITNRIAGSTVE